MDNWAKRERRTSRLIRYCYDEFIPEKGILSAKLVYALCQLTWITKKDASVDHTKTVLAPALGTLIGIKLVATTLRDLLEELRKQDDKRVIDLAEHLRKPVGFTLTYPFYRSDIGRDWLTSNQKEVGRALRMIAEPNSDELVVRRSYETVGTLSKLRRPKAGDLPPANLLTPLMACLDSRGKAPIVNQRTKLILKSLGLASSTLVEQYDRLVRFIGQPGIKDAFDLDRADFKTLKAANARELAHRDQDDAKYWRTINSGMMKKDHNKMTNALRKICNKAGLSVEEGADQDCLYDAIIRNYLGTEKHLLIEVKTDTAAPMCRMAVGQLLDYRWRLVENETIDLAILLPTKPAADMFRYLDQVGVKVWWFRDRRNKVRERRGNREVSAL